MVDVGFAGWGRVLKGNETESRLAYLSFSLSTALADSIHTAEYERGRGCVHYAHTSLEEGLRNHT